MAGSGNCSTEQIQELLEFLFEHQDLARGRMRSVDGRARSNRLWQEIAQKLNALGGCAKTVSQWMKVWADRKYLAKKAAAAVRVQHSGTGGGPSTAPQLAQWELKVLEIMGEGFGGPISTARVPAFPTPELNTPAIVNSVNSASGSSSQDHRPPTASIISELYTAPALNSATAGSSDLHPPTAIIISENNTTENDNAASTPYTRPTARRRLIQTRPSREQSFRVRMQDLEEQKVKELTNIRESLQELVSIAKNLFEKP
ncbi:uncharacterized protein LOC125490186 [Plutella xylostella]|uniref:uncharacterized protein LOC125490186 n=1 Tax=Plutella xylostella TaxID=51655 RepID=UPI0020322B35|nr:uncharacterized protein LOC125490186 [Plutella xylostella]